MLNHKFILIFILSTSLFAQSSMSGYGYGSFVESSDAASMSVSNKLLPSFKENVSLTNPSTWHNLLFAYLSTSVEAQNAKFQSSKSTNFLLSSVNLVIPWKQQMSFGIAFEPFLSREITVNDSTMSSFTFNDEELLFNRINSSSGGPSIGKFSFGYKLNELDSIGSSIGVIFGSSRSSRNLIIGNENHLLQSRDYFNGSSLDLFYSTSRFKIKDKPLILSLGYKHPLKSISVKHDSYQAFLDLNDNNYHDVNDFPDVGQALLPLTQKFDNEMKIRSINIGVDYEFKPRDHIQFEFLNWTDNGNHSLSTSTFEGYVEKRNKINISYVRFAKPFSSNRYNLKASLFLQNYGVKNLENINEVGLGLGVGVNFGLTGNQIDFAYKVSSKKGLYIVDNEIINMFNIGVSIGDLWFVKRREI